MNPEVDNGIKAEPDLNVDAPWWVGWRLRGCTVSLSVAYLCRWSLLSEGPLIGS